MAAHTFDAAEPQLDSYSIDPSEAPLFAGGASFNQRLQAPRRNNTWLVGGVAVAALAIGGLVFAVSQHHATPQASQVVAQQQAATANTAANNAAVSAQSAQASADSARSNAAEPVAAAPEPARTVTHRTPVRVPARVVVHASSARPAHIATSQSVAPVTPTAPAPLVIAPQAPVETPQVSPSAVGPPVITPTAPDASAPSPAPPAGDPAAGGGQ